MIGPGTPVPGSIPDYVPDSLSVIGGAGVLTGTIEDVRHWQDGNDLLIQEVAGTPGQNVEFYFSGIRSIRRLALAMEYEGGPDHYINIDLWDYIVPGWVTVFTFPNALGINLRYAYLPENGKRFFNTDFEAKGRVYHPVGGNAAHDSRVNYFALVP